MSLVLAASLSIACPSCSRAARVAGPRVDAASTLVGQHYRVRWGALDMPGVDDPVDARTGIYGFLAEGPFEQELEIRADEISATPAADGSPGSHLLCIDVRPSSSRLAGAKKNTVVVLDVQPIGDAPSVPFVVDAATSEKVPVDATKLIDENNMPCDRRIHRRAQWDDNLLRLHHWGRR